MNVKFLRPQQTQDMTTNIAKNLGYDEIKELLLSDAAMFSDLGGVIGVPGAHGMKNSALYRPWERLPPPSKALTEKRSLSATSVEKIYC